MSWSEIDWSNSDNCPRNGSMDDSVTLKRKQLEIVKKFKQRAFDDSTPDTFRFLRELSYKHDTNLIQITNQTYFRNV